MRQNAFRALASYVLSAESEKLPAVNLSVGVQGIGTGNPGYSVTVEKNLGASPRLINVYAGAGLRSNENHVHPVGGIKFSLGNGFSVGIQDDGHQQNPFATFSQGTWTTGIYLVRGKVPAYMFGIRY